MALSEQVAPRSPDPRWWVMEELLLHMRFLWFNAPVRPFHCARLVSEPEGELVAMVDGTPEEADALLAEAFRRRAYVIATPFSRPPDLVSRLRLAGFRLVHRQATYIYEPGCAGAEPSPPHRWRGWRLWRRPAAIRIDPVPAEDLPVWNRVCHGAFGPRGRSEAESLAEKRRAFAAMGDRARWYLARVGGQPAGCAILYQGEGAAQILAVGTLPRFRGQGVATALVQRLIQDWMAGGRGFLFLDTQPGSQAERIYLRLGFRTAYLRSVYAP